MICGQDPDEFLYVIGDSCRDCIRTSTLAKGPRDRQHEGNLLHALSPNYENILRVRLEKRDFGLADIRRLIAAIYADNLSRRNITSAGIT